VITILSFSRTKHIFSENNLDFNWAKCTSCSAIDLNRRPRTSCCTSCCKEQLVILKPIWAYGVQLWGTISHSNIEILQRFRNRYLGIIVNALWYVTNDTLHHDLNVPERRFKRLSQRYADEMEEHLNIFAIILMRNDETLSRLKRRLLQDLCTCL